MEQNRRDIPQPANPEELEVLHEEANLYNAGTFEEKLPHEMDTDYREDLELANTIANRIKEEGGLALVVGGYARDEALRRLGYEITSKDLDLEIYGLDFEHLKAILDGIGPHKTDVVGEAFGVLKLGRLDISIPRRDSKTGVGHKGFSIEGDPTMTVKEAARRRDFTMNALALNPLTGQIIDEYGGLEDLRNRVIRATDSELFTDDSLRVLRAMQFAGRFDFTIESETVRLCHSLSLHDLPKERIGEEWNKLLLRSLKPSTGLEAARQLGVIEKLHPELEALFGVEQEQEWHPEGDVWTHTKMVVDAAEAICHRENLAGRDKLVIMFGALCHDLGKPATTTFSEEKGRITSHGHEPAGLEPTKAFLHSINVPKHLIDRVLPLVAEHLYPTLNRGASDSALRRLASRMHPATIYELVLVAEADHQGRGLPWDGFEQGAELLAKAESLQVSESAPKPIIMGRHLIALGLEPGPQFGEILAKLYEAQQDGLFSTEEEGLSYYQNKLKN